MGTPTEIAREEYQQRVIALEGLVALLLHAVHAEAEPAIAAYRVELEKLTKPKQAHPASVSLQLNALLDLDKPPLP